MEIYKKLFFKKIYWAFWLEIEDNDLRIGDELISKFYSFISEVWINKMYLLISYKGRIFIIII